MALMQALVSLVGTRNGNRPPSLAAPGVSSLSHGIRNSMPSIRCFWPCPHYPSNTICSSGTSSVIFVPYPSPSVHGSSSSSTSGF